MAKYTVMTLVITKEQIHQDIPTEKMSWRLPELRAEFLMFVKSDRHDFQMFLRVLRVKRFSEEPSYHIFDVTEIITTAQTRIII